MPYNGSGTFTRTDGVRTGSNVFQQEESAGVDIEASLLDVEAQDMADGLTNALTKDGQTNPTADLPMNAKKHTNVADADARNNYAKASQTIDGTYWRVALTDGGTDAYAGTGQITVTGYANYMPFIVTFNETNTTTTPTVNIDSIGAKTLTKAGAVALTIGELQTDTPYLLVYNSTADDFILVGTQAADEVTCTINTSGEIKVKSLGVDTGQIAANAVTPAKTGFMNDASDFWVGSIDGTAPSYVKQPTGWGNVTDTTGTAGEYTIAHNLASTDYIVLTTGRTANENVYVTTKNANDFRVQCYNDAAGAVDTAFDFVLIQYT